MKYKFKVLLFFLCLFPCVVIAGSTQIKIVVFGDTNDSSIGQSVATDIKSYKKLAADIKAAVMNDGVSTTLDIYSGNNCSYNKLDSYLNNLSCKDDIVFFIYNGHGGRSHKDESKYPRMCLASHYESEWMKISDLNDRLRKKKPRLMVVVTDCCNSYYDRKGGDNESAYGITSNNSNGEGLRQLFLHFTGEVCITASSPGEYGWGTAQGGLLSLNFMDAIYKFDAKGSAANWRDFIQTVSDNTYNNSLQYYNHRRISNTQKPVFDVEVSKSDFNHDKEDDSDSGNNNAVDITDDDSSNNETISNDFDDDELYEDYFDDEDVNANVGRSFGNSLWMVLAGLLFLWSSKFLKLTGISANIMRILGLIFIVWSIIAFFSKL